MPPVTSHVLFNNYNQNGPGETRIDAAYDPTGGCKGGLQYVRIIPDGTATGVYYVQLKNIGLTKMGAADLNDGNFSFDIRRVNYVNCEVASLNPPTLSTESFSTAVQIDTANNRVIIYVYNNTGMINIPAGNRLNVSIIFNRFRIGGI